MAIDVLKPLPITHHTITLIAQSIKDTTEYKDRSRRVKSVKNVLQALKTMSETESIDIAVIGGAAVSSYGFVRPFKDIDVVVSVEDFNRLLRVCWQYDFKISYYNTSFMATLKYEDFEIEVFQEGMKSSYDTPLPSPNDFGVKGFGFPSFSTLIRLKLAAGRDKDHTDVVGLMKTVRHNAPETFQKTYKEIVQDLPEKHKDVLDNLLRAV